MKTIKTRKYLVSFVYTYDLFYGKETREKTAFEDSIMICRGDTIHEQDLETFKRKIKDIKSAITSLAILSITKIQ